MNKSVNPFVPIVNSLRNKATYKYYQFRIDTLQDPYKIRLRNTPYKILLLLSHMRSGSSLLTHILVSNPEIMGYGETHINYLSEANIKNLIFNVYWRLKDINMSHQYVLDKILHNHKIINDDWLASEQVYTIFLLRSPQRTVESILDLKPHLTEEDALDYYGQRLVQLQKYAQLINSKQRSLFMTHEQVLNDSDLIFKTLQNFLETKESFSENYKIFQTTGTKGVGDSSENIKTGRIVREARQLGSSISQEVKAKANYYFEQCFDTLSHYCQTVETRE